MIQALRARLIGFGFLWMAGWALFGSLLAYRIQEELISGQDVWLSSLQRELFRSTHAHMNSMSLVSVAVGLSLPFVSRSIPLSWLSRLSKALVASIVVFGAGMLWESFSPPSVGSVSVGSFLAAAGGGVFICSLLAFGVAALKGSSQNE